MGPAAGVGERRLSGSVPFWRRPVAAEVSGRRTGTGPAVCYNRGPRRESAVSASPEPSSLFSVELRTGRWAEMVAWYRHALGLRVVIRVLDEGYALLVAGGTRLAILSRAAPPAASARWSLAFEVDDLDAARRRLAAAGTEVPAPHDHAEGFREVVLADPDGNRIRLFHWADPATRR